MKSVLMRIAGFTGAPILTALAPFILLPVISRITGPSGWANFATGQSIGVLGMVVVLFGWGIVGPVRIARTPDARERADILRESLRSRLIMLAAGIPLTALAVALLTTDAYKLESVLIAVATAIGGLTPAWFCIGAGSPRDLTVYEALPKLAASLLALPIVLASGSIVWYPLLLAVASVAAYALHAQRTLAPHPKPDSTFRKDLGVLRRMLPTAAIDAAGNAYGITPVPIATTGLPPAEASSFASADRLYRVGILAVVAFGNAFQAWVLDPAATSPRSRHLAAIASHLGLGLIGGGAIALLGPWASGLVFGQEVAAEPLPSALFGLAFLCISTSTPFIRNMLIPHGRYRLVLIATLVASAVGLTTMIGGAVSGSAAVVALGVALAEATTLLVLVGPALASLRSPLAVDPGESPDLLERYEL